LVLVWLKMAALGLFWRADFTTFYSGWTTILDGQSPRLYDWDLQTVYYHRLLPDPAFRQGLLPYNHPPHSALLFCPLALLPFTLAFYLWALIQVGLLLVAWRFLLDLTARWDSSTRGLLLVTLLAFPPLFLTFQLGQTALLSLVCLLGFVRGVKKDRPWTTAIWLVLGTTKPQLMVIPALILLGGRRWRALGIATGLFALWAGVTALVLGPGCWWGFLESTAWSSRQFGNFGIDPLRMYNLKGLVTAGLGFEQAGLINGVSFAALLVAGCLVLWIWRGPWQPEASDFDLRLAFTLMLGLLCNPHCYGYDVLPLVVPAVLFLHSFHPRDERLWVAGSGAILAPLVFMLDVYGLREWAGRARPFFLLMVGLTVWMAWLLAAGGVRRDGCVAGTDRVKV
jgi:hypothetical protein